MSTPTNNITREIRRGSVFPDASLLAGTNSWNQGDMLIWDATAMEVVKAAAEADMETFIGIAPVTVVDGKLKSAYLGTDVDAAQASGGIPGPVYGVEASFTLKTGDAFDPGAPVYLSSTLDPQEISVTGTKEIGYFVGKAVAAAAAGQKGEAMVGHRFPGDVLQF